MHSKSIDTRSMHTTRVSIIHTCILLDSSSMDTVCVLASSRTASTVCIQQVL